MIRKFKSWMDKKQFCPTVEDIENKELGKLAKRLKGDSDKETLTNILEWQDRNIIGWSNRWYIFLIFYGFKTILRIHRKLSIVLCCVNFCVTNVTIYFIYLWNSSNNRSNFEYDLLNVDFNSFRTLYYLFAFISR